MIDIDSDSILKQKFPSIPLSSFWVILTEEYPEISKGAIMELLLFPAVCLGERGFQRSSKTETRHRNKLDPAADFTLQLLPITPHSIRHTEKLKQSNL